MADSTEVNVPKLAYETEYGSCYLGKAEDLLDSRDVEQTIGKIDLIFTSPPFPLNTKKKYGNLVGQEYIEIVQHFFCKYGLVPFRSNTTSVAINRPLCP